MGALESRSFEDTPDFPVGLFYRRWWYGSRTNHDRMFENRPAGFPMPGDFVQCIPLIIGITLFRLLFEHFVAKLAVHAFGLTTEPMLSKMPSPPPPSQAINSMKQFRQQLCVYESKKKKLLKKGATVPPPSQTKQQLWEQLQSQHHVSFETAKGWYELYSYDCSRTVKIQKFNEAAWKFGFGLFIFLFGLVAMSMTNVSLFNLENMWADIWHYEPDPLMRWYYYLSTAHYVHMSLFQLRDVKRKDFWEMFLHHIVTLVLLFQSYMLNFLKFGACTLILHDAADIFLELAKLFNYANYQKLTDSTFVLFALVFIAGRLGYFPFWLLHSTIVDAGAQFNYVVPWMLLNCFLGALLILNIIWASIILKMAYQFIVIGKVDKDARSDDEGDDEPASTDSKKQK